MGPNCQTEGPNTIFLKSQVKFIISHYFDIISTDKSIESIGIEAPLFPIQAVWGKFRLNLVQSPELSMCCPRHFQIVQRLHYRLGPSPAVKVVLVCKQSGASG